MSADAARIGEAWDAVYGAALDVRDPEARAELLGMASRLHALARDLSAPASPLCATCGDPLDKPSGAGASAFCAVAHRTKETPR